MRMRRPERARHDDGSPFRRGADHGPDSVVTEALYLRQNVQVEPLFDQWYAWAHLIAPATAARNVTDRHMKIMDSYISAPQVHAAAVKNPKMLGGPFIDY